MKKFLLAAAFLAVAGSTRSQSDTAGLALLGRVWGFMKYHSPAVASGRISWDSALLGFLPTYRRLTSRKEKNDSLQAFIDRAGGMPVGDSVAGPNYYIGFQPDDGANILLFRHEAAYPAIRYPDSSYGLLCLFRLWNAIEYWYPYKYGLETAWPEVLREFIPRMCVEKDFTTYTHDVAELLARIDDTHGYLGWMRDTVVNGGYIRPFTLQYVGRWVVSSVDGKTALQPGDIVDSIDGEPATALSGRLATECPASNAASRMIKLGLPMVRSHLKESRLTIRRKGVRVQLVVPNTHPAVPAAVDWNPAWFPYPKDTAYALLTGNVLYLNMALLNRNDSARWKPLIVGSRALIIDTRRNADEQNFTNAGDILLEMTLPAHTPFCRFKTAVPSRPGAFHLLPPTDQGLPHAASPYKGRIAVLIDGNSTSIGEFMAMAFRAVPGARLVGSATAGADGNVALLVLPGGGLAQFTGLGVYYPDGRETQRVGIQPDIAATVTLDDYLRKRDLALEKALLYLNGKP